MINYLSYSGLIKPRNYFKIKMIWVEKVFKKKLQMNKFKRTKGYGVVKNLTKKYLSRMKIDEKYSPV